MYIQEETPFRYASIWALPLCKAEKPPPPVLKFTFKFSKPHPNSPYPNFPQPYSHSNRRRRRHRRSCTFPTSLLHGFGLGDDALILDTPSSDPLDQPATEASDDIDITAIAADAAAQVEALDETHPHVDALEEPHPQVEALQEPDAPHTSPPSSSQTCPSIAKPPLHPGSEPSSSSSDLGYGSGEDDNDNEDSSSEANEQNMEVDNANKEDEEKEEEIPDPQDKSLLRSYANYVAKEIWLGDYSFSLLFAVDKMISKIVLIISKINEAVSVISHLHGVIHI
ncbi:hypothetical protein RIF29_39285 [Crotalaria pallida]|uniref:Uncharacterized protein n=1 Tax=Crotalaria pallida TaxID=3830 RepID=A0AAN9E3Y1_CROPI